MTDEFEIRCRYQLCRHMKWTAVTQYGCQKGHSMTEKYCPHFEFSAFGTEAA